MFIVRPVQSQDFEELLEIAQSTQGLYTLPKDPDLLRRHLEHSKASFSAEVTHPGEEFYEFALIDTEKDKLCGLAALMATSGSDHALHLARVENELLLPLTDGKGPTELCSLFISKPYRELGLGKLLSLARLHFVAAFPSRFHPKIIANMRGLIDEKRESPFWKSIGPRTPSFTPQELDAMVARSDPRLSEILPQKPLPLSQLSSEALAAIGKTHPNTRPALLILEEEGFCPNGLFDLIDAGPQIEASVAALKTVRESLLLPLQAIKAEFSSPQPHYLLSNGRLDFRAVIDEGEGAQLGALTLTQRVAEALKVAVQDSVRISYRGPL